MLRDHKTCFAFILLLASVSIAQASPFCSGSVDSSCGSTPGPDKCPTTTLVDCACPWGGYCVEPLPSHICTCCGTQVWSCPVSAQSRCTCFAGGPPPPPPPIPPPPPPPGNGNGKGNNGNGNGNNPIPPPPPSPPPPPPPPAGPPPPPPCGGVPGICGHISASENNARALKGIAVELRDSRGEIRSMTYTNSAGFYHFDPKPGTWFVYVPADRTQNVEPVRRGPFAMPFEADFWVSNVRSVLHVNAPASSFVLLTKAPHSGSSPPTISASTAEFVHSSTTGLDNQAELRPPRGAYFITCWQPLWCNGQISYVKTPSQSVNTGMVIEPQSPALEMACSTAYCP